LIHKFHHWLILHGRYICISRKPKCEECGLKPVCKYYLTVVKNQKETEKKKEEKRM
jgi:endonuclease-3